MDLRSVVHSSEKDIPDVHVIDIATDKATITDTKGNFGIVVRSGDTLVLGHIQKATGTLIKTDSIIRQEHIRLTGINKYKAPLRIFENFLQPTFCTSAFPSHKAYSHKSREIQIYDAL